MVCDTIATYQESGTIIVIGDCWDPYSMWRLGSVACVKLGVDSAMAGSLGVRLGFDLSGGSNVAPFRVL